MGARDTRRADLFSNRSLAILAGILWVAVVILAVAYLSGAGARSSVTDETEIATDVPTTGTGAAVATARPALTTSSTTTPISPLHASTTLPTRMTFASTTITTVEAITPALTVAAGGDVLGDRRVGVYIDKEGGKAVLARVKPLMDASDVAFVNLECPVSDEGIRNPHKEYTFRGRPDLINGLKTAGIDVVSLANNHTLDYGVKALLDTISRLDEAGVQYAGAGADAAVASSPALLSTRAGMVAVLAFTEIIPGGFAATNEQPGVSATTSDRGKLLQAVSAAAEKADFVIVSLHWGIEYENYATDDQRKLAHQIVDAGGDLILGHHPHVIQGMELYRDKLIAYSLGDFVFDHYSRDTGEAFVLQMVLPPQGPPAVKVTPIYLAEQNGVPGPVTGDEADAILTRLMRLSSGLGLELARSGDHAILGPLLPSR